MAATPAFAVPRATPPIPRGAPEGSDLLIEMRKRRVIGKDSSSWSAEQYTTLLRIREAQALGAFSLLRSKLGTLRGFAAEHRVGPGYKRLWLTVEGYRRYNFIRSQNARAYFESKGAKAAFVFRLRNLSGKRLFDARGLLSQEGIEIYNRILRKLPALWKYPNGTHMGNVRPPMAMPLGGPKRKLPPEKSAEKRLAALKRSGYVEISAAEVTNLLKVTKSSEETLRERSSLQMIQTKKGALFLLSPSDPLMALVARSRSGARAKSRKAPPNRPRRAPPGPPKRRLRGPGFPKRP